MSSDISNGGSAIAIGLRSNKQNTVALEWSHAVRGQIPTYILSIFHVRERSNRLQYVASVGNGWQHHQAAKFLLPT